ncbi:Tat pathway signal protein [Streptomyces sp. MS19]|uniref:Tat pathway signal protein n=1 Tax=Streptomyces sp. MS19 TaxID=3385972 RepID=UPI0039A107C4
MDQGEKNPNTALKALLAAGGVTYEALASCVRVTAAQSGKTLRTNRSAVAHWIAGTAPAPATVPFVVEALCRLLGRPVGAEEIGLAPQSADDLLSWDGDTLAMMGELGRRDLDVERRQALAAAAYSLQALALPGERWWAHRSDESARRSAASGRRVGRGDLEAVREMVAAFSRIDQRHGGGHARTAVVQYLITDVSTYLNGRFIDDQVRSDMFSAASELAYLAGWTAFDNFEHAVAQRYFVTALKLAAEANNPPTAGHALRGMAYQAVDMGHGAEAVNLIEAAMEGKRYSLASPRERAMFGAQLARSQAAAGRHRAAAAALVRAEEDLAADQSGAYEPDRLFIFGEADLTYQRAYALKYCGDLSGAAREFRKSVRARNSTAFARVHAVTLGELGSLQVRQGAIEEACTTWSRALDVVDGIHSARTRKVVQDMRQALSPLRRRGIAAVTRLDRAAAHYLRGAA